MDTLTSIIGYTGTLIIASCFMLAMIGFASKRPRLFTWANAVGGAALMIPALATRSELSIILNVFWLIISLNALLSIYSKGRIQASLVFLKVVSGVSITLIISIGIHRVMGADGVTAVILMLSFFAMPCFIIGFFCLMTQPDAPSSLKIYLLTSMAGNALCTPILLVDGNYPNLALQCICFTTGALKLLYDATSPGTAIMPH